MISNIKNFLVTNLSLLALLVVPAMALAIPTSVGAQQNKDADIDGGLCQGANLEVGGSKDCDKGDPEQSVNDLIATVINIFSVVVGVVAVIMIIVGGFRYITSGGDSGNVTGAKNTILYAVIGLVIVAFAQFIVRFVLQQATEATGDS